MPYLALNVDHFCTFPTNLNKLEVFIDVGKLEIGMSFGFRQNAQSFCQNEKLRRV